MTGTYVVLVMVTSVAVVLATGSNADTKASGCGEVQNMDMEETDTELIVTWDPPVDDSEGQLCGFFYYIDFMIDGVGQPGGEMFLRTNNFTITKNSCVGHWIAVTSSHIDGTPAAKVSIEYYSGIAGTGAVQDLKVDGLSVVWTQPENSENCGLTYQVDITNELQGTSYITDALTLPLPNAYCLTSNATVTAIVLGSDRNGQPTTLVHTMPEGIDAPVHEFTNPTTDGVQVGWRRSDAPNNCDILEIEFTIQGSAPIPRVLFNPDEITVNAIFTGLRPNTDFWYTARWILESGFHGIISDPVRFKTASCGQVQNLNVKETDTELIVTWDPPVEDGESRLCGHFYYIDFMIDGVGQPEEIFLRTNNFTITKGSCVDHWIAVTSSQIDGASAAKVSIEYYSGIAGTGAVQDLKVDGLSVVWTQPENSENCGLTYQVDITNELQGTSYITDALTHPLPNAYCLTSNATVTAIVLGSERNGQPTSLVHTMPEGIDAPVHEFTNPTTDGVQVGWRRSDAPNNCDIQAIEFTIQGSAPMPRVPFNPDEITVNATFTDLQPDTDFWYTARWILESGFHGIISDPVPFRTGTLATCGQVRNLNVTETDTELIVTWDPPIDDGPVQLCGLFYHIDYKITHILQRPVYFHFANEFTITKRSCGHHWIAIRSSHTTGAPAALLAIEHYSGIVGTGAVQFLQFEEMSAVWGRPNNSQNCQLIYRVDITNELGDTSDITNSHYFPLPNKYCLTNNATVTAIALGNKRSGQPMSLIHTMPEGSDAPVHQFTIPARNGAEVGWRRSDAPNYCRISEIEFTIADSAPIPRVPFNQDEVLVNATFTDLPSDIDFWYTAKWILESGVEGISSDPVKFTTAACGEVQNLKVEEDDTILTVTWDPPIDDGPIRLCGKFYHIDYMIDDIMQPTFEFLTTPNFVIHKGSCVNHWIGIRSSHPTGVPATQTSIEYYSGIKGTGAVQGLRVERLFAVWRKPENSHNCRLTYRVDITNELGETSDITNGGTFPLPNEYCLTNNATVTAIVSGNGRNGRPTSLVYTKPEGSDAPVHQFTNPTTNGALVGWRRSDAPNYCRISEIQFTISESTIFIPRVPFNPDENLIVANFTDLRPDMDYWYTAKWVLESGVNGTISEPVRFRTAGCGQVQNLNVKETDTELIVTWDPPIDDEEIRLCGGFYYIDYIIGDVIQPPVTFHTATDYTITKGSCVDHWITVTSSQPHGGPATRLSIEYYSGIVGTGAVQNLRVEGLSAVWTEPENSQNCRLIYRVDITNSLEETSAFTDGATFPLPAVYCLTNTATVTAIVSDNDRHGQPTSLAYTMPEGTDAPVHQFTKPAWDGALIGWRLGDAPNYCQISEIEFTILDSTSITRAPFNPDEDLVIASFTDLPSHIDFWYTATWILESGIKGITSEPVRFKTVPLTSPTDIRIILLDDGGVNITWTQLYNIEFVTEHVTTVVSSGPNHLVPDECPTDAGIMYTYVSKPEETTFFFAESRPHQYYKITVTTHFAGLGMQITGGSSMILTPTDTPGEVLVQHWQCSEPGVPYDVTTFLSWSIPCDINGPLLRFDYKIFGRVTGELDTDYCELQFDSGQKFIDDSQSTLFVVETEKFAKYGHECEVGSAKGEQLPMFQFGGSVSTQIKNVLIRAKMASEMNKRGNRFLRSQKAVDNEHFNHLNYPYILHPFSTIRTYWEILMMCTYLIIFVTMPLDVASYNFPLKKHLNNNIHWKLFRNTFDLVCLADVVVNFFTGYVDVRRKVIIMKPRKIAIRYVLTFFLPDLLSSIPTHMDIFIGRTYLDILPPVLSLQYISVLKAVRFPTYLTYCVRTTELLNISQMKSHIMMTFFSYIMYFHVLTCTNMALIGFNKPLIERVYTDDDTHNYYVVWSQKHVRHPIDFREGYLMLLRETTYLATFCYANATLGDTLPKWYLILVWCISKLVFTYFIASLMEILMTFRSSSRKYFEMVRELQEYMLHKQLPIPLQQRLLTYYEFKFQKSYFRESDILNTISGQLKQDLLMHSCRRLVEHVEFFQNLPIALIIRIVSALSTEIYLVNDVIIKANAIGTCMYFIASGCVAVYTKSGHEVRHLADGEYFGEYSMLRNCQPRESSIVAIEICELYRLGYRDFVKAILPYPDLLEKITKHALDRIEMTEFLEDRATSARQTFIHQS